MFSEKLPAVFSGIVSFRNSRFFILTFHATSSLSKTTTNERIPLDGCQMNLPFNAYHCSILHLNNEMRSTIQLQLFLPNKVSKKLGIISTYLNHILDIWVTSLFLCGSQWLAVTLLQGVSHARRRNGSSCHHLEPISCRTGHL